MSRYTTELRFMLETQNGNTASGTADDVMTVINNTRSWLFNFDYPSTELTDSEKLHLEKNFMLQYYTREIGFETFGLFKMKLQAKLWEIMPKYEKLYALEHQNLDFFSDVDYTKRTTGDSNKRTGNVTHQNNGKDTTISSGSINDQAGGKLTSIKTGSVTDQNTGSSTNTTNGKYKDTAGGSDVSIFSDTPQSEVDLSADSGSYMTNATKDIKGTTNEREYTNLQVVDQDNKGKTQTFNNLKDETTDTRSNTKTFNNYKVENENNKGLTDTYNNLLDTVDLTERTFGNMGNNLDKFIKYRDNILNIEQMIINECSDLFMYLWI